MEIRNLQHLNVNADVTSPFSLSWSEDNKIAVVTKEGLVIMVLTPEPTSDQSRLPLQRTLAAVTHESPAGYSEVSTDGLVTRLDRGDVYRLILDTPLSPHLLGSQTPGPRIVQHRWSPAGSLYNARCLLATVTTWGQCSLRSQCVNMWPAVGDVSLVIARRLTSDWSTLGEREDPERRLRELQRRADKLLTIAVCWGLRVHNGQTMLVAAQRSGDVVLLSVSREGTPTFQATFPSHLEGITAIEVLKDNVIAAGDRTGRVKLFTLPATHDKTPAATGEEPPRNAPPATRMEHQRPEPREAAPPTPTPPAGGGDEESDGPLAPLEVEARDLWTERDDLMVSQLLSLPHTLVAFKGGYLVAFSLDDLAVTTEVIDSFSIAGGVVLNDQCVAVATQYSSEIVVATVTRGGVACDRIQTSLQARGNMGAGLARSKGGAMWAVLVCKNQTSDKSASVVNFFNFVGLVDNMANILEMEAPKQNLSLWYDHLEVARINTMNKRCFEEGHCLPPTPERFDGLTLYQLRVWRWLYLTKAALMKRLEKLDNRPFSGTEEQHPLESLAATIESLIVAKHLCRLVENVAARLQVGSALSPWELQSVFLARRYLDSALPDLASNPGPTVKRARRALNITLPADVPAAETCSLCGAESSFHSYETSLCTNQHKIPRCSISLLQVDQVPYLLCVVCGRIAHPRLASFATVSQPPACVFCEHILETVEYPGRRPDGTPGQPDRDRGNDGGGEEDEEEQFD